MKALLLTLALGGCAVAPTQQARQITQTEDLDAVAGCQYIAPVNGVEPLLSGTNALSGAPNARAQALNAAAGQGATHVVWKQVQGAYANGSAYRCP